MAIDVETVCTDSDLLNRAGADRVKRAKPELSERTAARAEGLREVLSDLAGRSPPISEADIQTPSELREMVMYRSLNIIFENATASADSLHAYLAKQYADQYKAVSKRSITVVGGARGPSGGSFRMERR